MSVAFVDTTVLTDAVLKSGNQRVAAEGALRRHAVTKLPVYALKEFKLGPLSYYTWLHNKLVLLRSVDSALEAIQRAIPWQKYRAQTALQAFRDARVEIAAMTPSQVRTRGDYANYEYDQLRLILKRRIFRAWRRRRKVTTEVVEELACFLESEPVEKHDGTINLRRADCQGACEIASKLRARLGEITALHKVARANESRREFARMAKVLRTLFRTPTRSIDSEACRNLGDSVFAALCPTDAVILTTNTADHGLLAASVGKRVESP